MYYTCTVYVPFYMYMYVVQAEYTCTRT